MKTMYQNYWRLTIKIMKYKGCLYFGRKSNGSNILKFEKGYRGAWFIDPQFWMPKN